MANKGQKYRRSEIGLELGVAADKYAVLVKSGAVAGIVVREDGLHPFTNEIFPNKVDETAFRMFGRNDQRGKLLEDASAVVPLYFSGENNEFYEFKGFVRYVNKVPYPGKPERVFEFVS